MPLTVFADTFYWIAIARPRDPRHAKVLAWTAAHRRARLVTTDEVLTEYLNGLSKAGPQARRHATATVHPVRTDPTAMVLPQTRADFDAALAFYEARLDKDYSLTDCRSMVAMRALAIAEVLSNDRHFTQEGFTVLFP